MKFKQGSPALLNQESDAWVRDSLGGSNSRRLSVLEAGSDDQGGGNGVLARPASWTTDADFLLRARTVEGQGGLWGLFLQGPWSCVQLLPCDLITHSRHPRRGN